ncbi:TonB-dependent receptor [Gayadomonas joobiniege]|uniref:TonB-dependent receptor n=1 Tax=Gayadomonas joobiniege TaxID=1234606 RepID=UPI000371C13A|nr:TonB-dependent receptor [Gayadomonas joobiniege]
MYKLSKVALVCSALLTTATQAQTINGQVLNANGKSIAKAKISVMGSNKKVIADENGRFKINTNKSNPELHISASGYAHKNQAIDFNQKNNQTLTITLVSSPIEVIDVTATPFHSSTIESAMPVSVLSGDRLREQQASTLGESLKSEIGVHSSSYGGVASTPVIRGLSGPRVLISQNGLDAGDVSRIGPDHSVTTEATTAQQIEVLRGPATLFYGSGAIGGVVNVVDERIPKSSDTFGEWTLQKGTNDQQKLASASLNTGSEQFAFHLDGFWRESENYEAGKQKNRIRQLVDNSFEDSTGGTLGVSYIADKGYAGISYGRLEREYGIPGHGEEGESVYADLTQDRVQLQSEVDIDSGALKALHSRLSYTDYEHAEIENGEVGTLFSNQTSEAKFDFMQQEIAGWRGGISLHYKKSEFSAIGDEAFAPASDNETFAIAMMQEQHFGNFLVQLGARTEYITLKSKSSQIEMFDVHSHEDHSDDEDHHDEDEHGDEHGDDHENEHPTEDIEVDAIDQSFATVNLSGGVVWDFVPGYNLGIAVSHAERAPSAAEILSFGPHIGAQTYEIGALYEIHEEAENEYHIDVLSADQPLELSNNIDLTLRKYEGDFGFVVNVFYNRVHNYYYQAETGLFAEFSHEHEDEMHEDADEHDTDHDEEHEHSDELPVFVFNHADAKLYGFEAQFVWQATEHLKTRVFADYVRAKLIEGGDLPRTPPLRFGGEINYNWQAFTSKLSFTRYDSQDKVAQYESQTNGYNLIDANVSYNLNIAQQDISVYLKAHNLGDVYAKNHTSFIKDEAPIAGRTLHFGIRGYF